MVTIGDNSGVPTIRISWSPPTTNGSPLSAYLIEIQAVGGAWLSTTECDGSTTAIFSNRYCDVQMSTLRAAPFSLALGAGIVVRAKAQNAIGWATLWSAPTPGTTVTVQDVPSAPLSAPLTLAAGTQSLTVEMPVVIAGSEGGSPITSYNLQYDKGGPLGTATAGPAQNSDFVSLIGEVPATNTAQRSLSMSGLVANTIYTFRYRVANKHGWSAWSPSLKALTATAPEAMVAPTVSLAPNPTEIRIEWIQPATGGTPITAYEVVI